MGINLNFAELFVGAVARYDLSGGLLALGRQDLNFGADALERMARYHGLRLGDLEGDEKHLSQESFFRALGFSAVESLDVSDYEGAEHIFDLFHELER